MIGAYFQVYDKLIVLIWQMIAFRLQLGANFYQEIVRRYNEVIKSSPIRALDYNKLALEECVHEKSDFKLTLRLYLWIIQEEYELHIRNRLSKGQSEILDAQFRIMMQNRLLREGWDDLNAKLAFPDNLRQHVKGILANDKKLRDNEQA